VEMAGNSPINNEIIVDKQNEYRNKQEKHKNRTPIENL
jgi:hypothetical protein